MDEKIAFRAELVAQDVWIAENAVVLGNVMIGARSSVWFQTVVRGDTERIEIGTETNIQDASVLHADPGSPCLIGNRVTVGHRAIVHGAQVADDVMIGMGAILLNEAKIGSGSVIAAGSLVPEGAAIPENSLVMGVPGRVKREVSDAERQRIQHAAEHYVRAAVAYREAGH